MKYNWSIIGHEKQLESLESDIETGNLAHAYLMVGPNSVGKYTVSKKLACILQCPNNFCHKCPVCLQIDKGFHFDTIELRDDGGSVGIDTMKNIIERLNMTPQSFYKILLIQSVERMTVEAANSFLKTLEEPSSNTVIIFTANNLRDVLPTIISRVRTVNFGLMPIGYLKAKLKNIFPESDDESIKKACLFSMGKTGKAVNLMRNPDALSEHVSVYHNIQNFISNKNIVDGFRYIDEIIDNPKKIETFYSLLIQVVRSKFLDETRYDVQEKYINTLLKILDAGILSKRNVNLRLYLENLFLSL